MKNQGILCFFSIFLLILFLMERETDLLFEISQSLRDKKQEGYTKQTFVGKYDLLKTHIEIINDKGSKLFNRDVGSYTSIFLEKLTPYETDIKLYCIKTLAEIIKDYIQKIDKKAETFLIVGIGNKNYVSDSLGPLVTNSIIITRHAKLNNPKVLDARLKSVCAISPSVLGVTGIQTYDIVKGVIDNVRPDIVILVDSILAKSYSYLGKCFQVSTNGLVPGSGVDNTQKALSSSTLNTPIISIGVPLVVSAQNLITEYVDKKIRELENLIVTAKDIDIIVKNDANIVATSLNLAINNKMGFDEILDYMN